MNFLKKLKCSVIGEVLHGFYWQIELSVKMIRIKHSIGLL